MEKILEEIQKDKLINKYLYQYTWLSGSSTKVYPISARYEKNNIKEITIQINTEKNLFNKLIERYKNNYKNIDYGYFWKSDGSCPSQLVFKFKVVE